MKRTLYLMFSLLVMFFLVACGGSETDEAETDEVDVADEEEEQAEDQVEDQADEEEEAESPEAEETEESEETTYDEVLLDDDYAKVVLTEIETVSDDIFGDEHQIKLEIENKGDETIEVQARETSIDGLMVDDMVIFSETVAGGKKANGTLTIMAMDDELPELNENLEFQLKILDDGFMDITSADVSVEIK